MVIVTVAGVFRGYLNGISDIIPISISQVLEVIIKFIFGLIFALVGAKYRFDLSVISALTVLGVTIGSHISTLYLMVCVKNRISVNNAEQKVKITFNKDVIKRIVIIALPLTFSSAIMGISNIFDLGLIMQRLVSIGYTEVEANSLYGNYTTLVIPLLNLVIALISPISVAALPMIAGAHYLNDKDLLIENSKTLIEFTAFISIPIAFGFFAFSKEILLLLFKDNSALIAAPLLMLLVPSMIFLPLLTISNTILEANEQIHLPLISMSVAAIVKFFVSFYLIGDSEFGISGAPLGTSISYGIGFLVSLILLLRKTNIRLHVFSALYKPVLISFISVFGAKLLYIWMLRGINSMLSFIISVFLSVIIYLIISYFMGAFSFKKIKKLSKLPKIV